MSLRSEKKYNVKTETTITNTETGQEYESEEAMQADIDDPNTSTTVEKIRRDVKVFAPSLIGMPLDVAIMIRDIYNDTYMTAKRKFPFDGDLITDPKGTNSRLMKIKKDLFAYLGLSGDGKPIPKVGEGDISNVDPALAAAAGLGLPKSNTATMAGG